MNIILKRIFGIFAVFFFAIVSHSYALNVETHKAFNEYITRNSLNGFSLGTYLNDKLGFKNSDEEKFINLKIWEIIRDGGRYEDIPYWFMPYLRSVNHFHNPLSDTGFSGIWGYNWLTGQSSITWSQSSTGTQSPGGHYSWYDARDYFYNALTAADKVTREENYADMFRGVGQLMHLVEDLSVPEHTRDDGHYIFDSYEDWVHGTGDDGENNVDIDPLAGIVSVRNTDLQSYTDIVPIFYDASVLGNINPLASVPVANLFDTNQYYSGADPDVTRSSDIGLAEYTNANFLSPDSRFSVIFPYPDWSSVIEHDVIIDSTSGETRIYLEKLGYGEGGYGESITYLAATRRFYKYLPAPLKHLGVFFDERVYSNYAQKLIPRAVGYSAGLLNYFFRGTLEITAPDENIYAITDGSITPHQFTSIKAKVRNSTPDTIPGEEIQNGILQAVAKYKIRPNYQEDLSNDPPTESEMQDVEYSYSVSQPVAISSLSSVTAEDIIFDFMSDPIPVGITDLYLQVIFKGTLGNEEDIAIAAGLLDLNEPQHFSIWNATDMFYLDGVLRTADEIRNTPELLARVDFDSDGIVNETAIGEPYIEPYDITTYLAFYPTTETPALYNGTYTPLLPERYGRVIILLDMDEFYLRIHREAVIPPENYDVDLLFTGVTNQDNDGVFENTQVNTFRGIIQHQWSAHSRYYPDAAGISTAPWPIPSNTDPYPANFTSP